MRDNEKILKILRKKNISNDFNLIYDNILNIEYNQIDNSSLKHAHKKLLSWYKKIMHNRYPNGIPTQQFYDDISDRITYSKLEDPVGKIYSVNSDDNWFSNILIPYNSNIFNLGDKWFYKHIELKTTHPTNISFVGESTFSEYKAGITNKKSHTDQIIQIGNQNNQSKVNDLTLKYGVQFR